MTDKELIAAFSTGKYPKASDYAALINKSSEGNSINVYEIGETFEHQDGSIAYELESASNTAWGNLPKYSICVHVNTKQNTVRVFLGYSQPNKYVDVAAGGAIMVIRTNDTDEYSNWELLNNISVATNNNSGNGIQTIILINNDPEVAADVLQNRGISLNENSLYVFKNGTSAVLNLTIDYDSGRAVTISPNDAVMLIYNGNVGQDGGAQFGIVSIPISA